MGPSVGDRERLTGVGGGVGRACDGHTREQRAAVRRSDRISPDLDRTGVATGSAARGAERDLVDVEQVERSVELDPVARAEPAALTAAADVGRRGLGRAWRVAGGITSQSMVRDEQTNEVGSLQ